MKSCLGRVSLIGTALALLTPASALAAAFTIDDTLVNELIRFSANDFEGGLTLDGQLFQQGNGNPNSVDVPEADGNGNPIVHNFDGLWITGGEALPPTLQVAFLEPGTGALSDVLFVQFIDQGDGFGRILGHFVSDASEQGLDPSVYLDDGFEVTNWPEENGPYLFSAPFFGGSANSDVAEVPEPASCGLVIAGLLGLAGWRRMCA
jgi:hypothetical protein